MRLSDCTRLVCVCRVRVAGRCGQIQAGAEINAMPFFLSSYILHFACLCNTFKIKQVFDALLYI
ncbi:MAG: hypothetical protein DRH24_06005 [Deltaproteobacteria bacterium]|nr:MAG: hypothetical protein DRH24_06005 [Deltaproteobacteria bacterium]